MKLTVQIIPQDGQFTAVIVAERQGKEPREIRLLPSGTAHQSFDNVLEWLTVENRRGEWSRLFGSQS